MRSVLLTAAAASAVFALAPANAALTHDYEFATDYSDSVAGGVSLAESFRSPATGSVNAGSYTYEQGAGLILASQLPGSSYTIDISANFRKVTGYNKLISFNDLSSDLGLYILNGQLNLFDVETGSDTIAAGSAFDIRLTRDGTSGLITGFLNGVQQFTYLDSGNAFAASSALWFLRDDTDQNSEDSAGTADYIRIYDDPNGQFGSPTPEPATWAMMVGGFAMVGFAMRRRPRVTFA